MPDNNTNLPILDDIIKPGDTEKAMHQPSSNTQSSSWSDDETDDSSTTAIYAKTNLHTASDDRSDKVELYTDNQSDIEVIDRIEVSPATETDDGPPMDEVLHDEIFADVETNRASTIDLPDIDALTEEILDNLILQIEPLLRDRIQQTLSKHFPGKTRTD